jgi:hypothetical protein
VLSGANMNFDRLRFVAERAEIGEGREALLAVTIPERPGAFREFCGAIGAGVVTEFNYRLSGRTDAQIFVGVATRSRHDGQRLAERLRAMGYETADLSGNEMAKLHVRYMVGGRTPHVSSERVCRFEFPERPARCCSSSMRSAGAGTSACSTTGTTGPTSAACWRDSKCRLARDRRSKRFCRDSDTSFISKRAAITAVCTDMHRPYLNAVGEVLQHAEVVFDKFHVLQHASAALDDVRRQEFFRAGAVMREHGRGKRWLLLRRWKTVRGSKREELQTLFGTHKRGGCAERWNTTGFEQDQVVGAEQLPRNLEDASHF